MISLRKFQFGLFLIAALVLLSVAAGCDAKQVDEGYARDTLFSVEPTRGGSWSVFLTHDESVVYCTPDPELGRDIKNMLFEHDGEVVIWFKSVDFFRDTEGELFGTNECADYMDFISVIIMSVEPVPSRGVADG